MQMHKAMPVPASGAHAGMDRGGMGIPIRATTTQKIAWAILSVLMLAASVLFPATTTNLRLSARTAGGAVMPPGMIMLRDTPAETTRDMAAVDPRTVSYTAPPTAHGDQALPPRLVNGVKEFDLEVSVIKWNILPYKQVMAYAFNGRSPARASASPRATASDSMSQIDCPSRPVCIGTA
jgi:hypothetical protein